MSSDIKQMRFTKKKDEINLAAYNHVAKGNKNLFKKKIVWSEDLTTQE
jgi:hypothetical protein